MRDRRTKHFAYCAVIWLKRSVASEIDIYHLMQGDVARLPYLVDELEEVLGLRIVVTEAAIEISDRTAV